MDIISSYPAIITALGANPTTSFPVIKSIPARPSTSYPVDEFARDEITVWLPNR